MLTAGELIVEPDIIDSSMKIMDALQALLRAPHGVLLVRDGQRDVGIITTLSALHAMAGEMVPSPSTARDLVAARVTAVSPEAPWPTFWKQIKANGAVPVSGPAGSICGVVTLAALAEKAAFTAVELERELDAVISCSSDEILIADGEGKVLRANSAFEENFGVRVSEVLGQKVSELERKKIFFPSVTRLVLQKRSPQTVIQSQRNGRKLLATGTPSFNPDGSIFRVVVNTRDITRLNDLKHQLEEAELLKNRYYQELLELHQGPTLSGEIFFASPIMQDLIKTARKIARVDSTVLLTGESGVVKGVRARYEHDTGPRRNKPFITVNCGAIPENLLESELFGYVGGAFTGALKEGKVGKLELAHEGTLFLDEIAELPLNLQVKLLHVLQESVISRIGDAREIKLDLRIIAATNRVLEQEVAEGRFREDLYFRLNVIPLEIPPLRKRLEDIEPLASHFLNKFNRKYRKDKQFTPDALKALTAYHWPGNIRELENLVERMVIVVDEAYIARRHLPDYILSAKQIVSPEGQAILPLQPLKNAREAVEQDLLRQALQHCRTTYEIARLLDVDQSTVVRKLKKYNLQFFDEKMHKN